MADPPPQTPVTPPKAKPTKPPGAIHITPLSDKAASYQNPDRYATGSEPATVRVDDVNAHLIEDCNTSRILPFEDFVIKILDLPKDWKIKWSEQLGSALALAEWKTYKEAWYTQSKENALYNPFSKLCNKVIATMTGQEGPKSLVVYEHDKGFQIGYAKRSPDVAVTVWGLAEKVGGKLDDQKKVFVGFDKKGSKKVFWEQIRMFVEIKNTSNGRTLGGESFLSPTFIRRPSKGESSRVDSGVTSSSGSRKRGVDSTTVGQTSAQESQKRQKTSRSTHTSVRMVLDSEKLLEGPPPTDNNSPGHVRLQCAGYALEMLTSGRVRSHAFGMLVDGPNIQLQYYDRSMIVKTHAINIFDEDEQRLFIAALYRFTQFTTAEWGLLLNGNEEDLETNTEGEDNGKNHSVDRLAGMKFILEKDGNQKRIRLVRLIFRSHGIIGRGTIVTEAECICGEDRCECNWKGSLVVKISFPAIGRVLEYDLINEALEKARQDHEWVQYHLPCILWSQAIPFGDDTPQGQLAKLFPDNYEKRRTCITVQEMLQPIHDLATPEEFAQVLYDILQCHRWLFRIADILHRDISLNNMMFRRDTATGEVYGVLNDFDLSSRVTEDREASSKERTGTKPYMAWELFDKEWKGGHLYRHDLESMFYGSLCLFARYKGPRERVDVSKEYLLPYDDWFTGTYKEVCHSKQLLVLRGKFEPTVTDFFQNFTPWVIGVRLCIFAGFTSKNLFQSGLVTSSFDEETLNDEFTYARIREIMSHFNGVQLKLRTTISLD